MPRYSINFNEFCDDDFSFYFVDGMSANKTQKKKMIRIIKRIIKQLEK